MAHEQLSMKDHHVVVFGGSGGIGEAVTLKMAEKGVGKITFTYGKNKTKADELFRKLGLMGAQQVYAVQLDVPKTDSGIPRFTDALEQIARVAGAEISHAVNTIGISPNRPWTEQTIEGKDGWLDIFQTNVFWPFIMVRALALRMAEKGVRGSIVDINSSNAFNSHAEFSLGYDMSKAAQAKMIPILAEELAKRGIRLNGASPGWVDTPMNNSVPNLKEELKKIWLGRMVKPSEVADLIAYLLFGEGAAMITGQNFLTDGGYR